MSGHTPGPWFNTSQDDTPMGEVMDQPLDSDVSLHISVSGPNAKADARLIASVPDLLAVAMSARLYLRDLPPAPNTLPRNCVLDLLDAAIAKATGS